jgi:beta-galactosidase
MANAPSPTEGFHFMRAIAIVVVIFGLVVQGALLQPPTSAGQIKQNFFPVAVWYGGGKARAPMLEPDPKSKKHLWRTDLQTIKKVGFNAIRCWVDWASAEPVEGRFHLDTIDVLMELAEEIGLKVLVQVYADSAPEWVGKKYPDSHFVSISGDVMPSESAPGFCQDHPGVHSAILGFYAAIAERVKNRSAFHGWDLWSEPHVINWAAATYLVSPEFCFCPYTTARFRLWLKKKYGSLDALNQAWYRRFADWDDVRPNRLSTILSYTDYVDWRFFIIDKVAEDLRSRYETVKRIVPGRVATSHAAAPSLFTSPLGGDGNPDDWLMARQVDYWGTSFYPKHSFPVGRDVAWRGALLDFSRSACMTQQDGFYIGELQGGFGTIALRVSSTVTSDDVKTWMWSALARGAKGINVYAWYPMSSGYESGGFGLINLDGTITERAKVAGQVASIVDRNQALFLNARPVPAEVAIVYNSLSYMVGGRQPRPAAGAQSEYMSIERNSMLGIHRALFPSNVPVDFIHINQIGEGQASRYKLILLPYPLMIHERAANGLVEFVRNGGTLMTEARLAWNDERGRAKEMIPGFGLHDVMGCREVAIQQTVSGKADMTIVSDDESIPLLQTGEKLRGSLYEEALAPLSARARVIAKFGDGSPAIIASGYGRGKAIMVGTFFGTHYEQERDPTLAKFFNGLLDWAGVSRPLEITGTTGDQPVEVRTMEARADKLVFVFNHGATVTEPTIRLKYPATSYNFSDLATGLAISSPSERERMALQKRLDPGEVWVIRISPK